LSRFPSPVKNIKTGTFAVLLNINARGVSKKVRDTISQIVPEEDLFISHSELEAETHAHEIIKRRYKGVFSGGGDGSLILLVNLLWENVIKLNEELSSGSNAAIRDGYKGTGDIVIEPYRFPFLGILKLGTGNGWASVVGSKKGVEQLKYVLAGGDLKFTPFDLIFTENRRFHFSGLGWDAAILNDYIDFKKLGNRFPYLKKYLASLPGYISSMMIRTIPRELTKQILNLKQSRCEIVNRGARVFRIEGGGRPVPVRFGRGDRIFSGNVNVVGVATTPNYGFNLKAFPYAMTMPGMMNLRIIQAGIPELIMNAGPIWNGVYCSPKIHDFLVSDVEIFFSASMPLQIGGDAEGMRDYIRYKVVPDAVRTLDFIGW